MRSAQRHLAKRCLWAFLGHSTWLRGVDHPARNAVRRDHRRYDDVDVENRTHHTGVLRRWRPSLSIKALELFKNVVGIDVWIHSRREGQHLVEDGVERLTHGPNGIQERF